MRYRLECPANRYVFKSRLNCSESTAGSLRQSGSEFQTVGPATKKHGSQRCRVELVELTVDDILRIYQRHDVLGGRSSSSSNCRKEIPLLTGKDVARALR